MGYAYEAFSTLPGSGEERRPDDPEGWSGDVNTNVQVNAGAFPGSNADEGPVVQVRSDTAVGDEADAWTASSGRR